MDIGELMQKRVLGVPMPILAGALAVGAVYAAVTLKPSAEPAGDDSEPDTDTATGDAGSDSQPVFTAIQSPVTPGVGSVTAVTQDTNEQWGRRAIEWLIANGETVQLATAAITKYLEGSALSFEEGRVRDRAVGQFSIPPEGPPLSRVQPYKGPASKQGEPPTQHLVKGLSDDSWEELARLYYGMVNPATINLLRSRNTSLRGPFSPGQSVQIPKYHNPKYIKAHQRSNTVYEIARKNGTTPDRVIALNKGLDFPVKPGTRVRVA